MSEANQAALASVKTEEGKGHLSALLEACDTKMEPTVKDEVLSVIQDIVFKSTSNSAISADNVDLIDALEAAVAEIDRKISDQVNVVLHNEAFQKLEGSWRGLHHLVTSTVSGPDLKVKVFNCSKREVYKDVRKGLAGNFHKTKLFKKVFSENFDTNNAEPFGAIVGDYEFGPSGVDVDTLKGMSQIAAAAHAPFLTGGSPALYGLESWTEVNNPDDLAAKQDGPEFAAWREMRNSENSRYVGVCAPRFLSRRPYGPNDEPVERFAFEETTNGKDHNQYCWSNAAYAFAANVNKSFDEFNWTTSITGKQGGGAVEGLPVHTFKTDTGDVDQKCPAEVSIPNGRQNEMSKTGIIPLSHWKNTDIAAFMSADSLRKPADYVDAATAANERLGCQLPYIFACSRFAHFLNRMMYDKIGSYTSRDMLVKDLSNWLNQYVCIDEDPSEEAMRKQPLKMGSKVDIEEDPKNPGSYNAIFYLIPQYKLVNIDVSLRLVSKVPDKK